MEKRETAFLDNEHQIQKYQTTQLSRQIKNVCHRFIPAFTQTTKKINNF